MLFRMLLHGFHRRSALSQSNFRFMFKATFAITKLTNASANMMFQLL